MISYGFRKTLSCSFDEAAERILPLIADHGFSIVTQIDLKEKFSQKLGIDCGQYIVLGLCNPMLAHQAVMAEPDVGLFFPCNMIVYEIEDGVAVAVMKPSEMMDMIENKKLREVASEVEAELDALFSEIK